MGLISLASIIVLVGLFYFFSDEDTINTELLDTLKLTQTNISRGYANGFVLNARIKNNHPTQLINTLIVRSTLSDCKANQIDCLSIGEEDNRIKIRIPPNQARDITINLRIKQLHPTQGEASWHHQAISAQ